MVAFRGHWYDAHLRDKDTEKTSNTCLADGREGTPEPGMVDFKTIFGPHGYI